MAVGEAVERVLAEERLAGRTVRLTERRLLIYRDAGHRRLMAEVGLDRVLDLEVVTRTRTDLLGAGTVLILVGMGVLAVGGRTPRTSLPGAGAGLLLVAVGLALLLFPHVQEWRLIGNSGPLHCARLGRGDLARLERLRAVWPGVAPPRWPGPQAPL